MIYALGYDAENPAIFTHCLGGTATPQAALPRTPEPPKGAEQAI